MATFMTRRIYKSPQEPAGGQQTPPANGNPTDPNGGGTNNPGNPSPQPGSQQQEPKPVTFTTEQQEHLNKLIGNTRTEAREAAKKEYETQLQKDKDAQAALELTRKGEFEKLYNDEKAKREALEPKVTTFETKVKTLADRVNAGIDGEIKDWPDSVKKSDPGKEVDVEDRLKWVENMRDIAKELSGRRAPNTGLGGGGPLGGPNGGGVDATDQYLNNTYTRPAPKQQ